MSTPTDDSTLHVPDEDKDIERQVSRRRSELPLLRLQTSQGTFELGASGDNGASDIVKLRAIFLRDRIAYLVKDRERNLTPMTKGWSLTWVLTDVADPNSYANAGFVERARTLRLLAEGFRSLSEEKVVTPRDVLKRWNKGIDKLEELAIKSKHRITPEYEVDYWSGVFLFKHCRYLLIDLEKFSSSGSERGQKDEISALFESYGGGGSVSPSKKFEDMRKSFTSAFSSRPRAKPAWHDTYLHLEERTFMIFANRYNETYNEKGESVFPRENEATSKAFVDAIEQSLQHEALPQSPPARISLGSFKSGQRSLSSPTYDENADTFTFGLIELEYQVLSRVRFREQAFSDMVHSVRKVLELSHPQALPLHRKATDLYNRISLYAERDRAVYGQKEDIEFVEKWMTNHPTHCEARDVSLKYVF